MMRARHIRTGKVYDVVDTDAREKCGGEWRPCVIYRDERRCYVRPLVGFTAAFALEPAQWWVRFFGRGR